jgi:methionyl-tRNA formyltransferase
MCRKFEKEDGEIDPFNDTMLSIRKKRQAFALWPKLYFILDEKRYVIDALTLKESVVIGDLAN